MGFLEKFRRAMGLDPNDDDYMDEEGIDATVTPLRERQRNAALAENSSRSSDEEMPSAAIQAQPTANNVPAETSPAMREERPDPSVIFTSVVDLFNQALPDFLQKSVDPQRQRQLLFEALDSRIKDYFEQLDRNAERRLQGRYKADCQKLQEQIDRLHEKSRKNDEDIANAKNLQLSAERQKRSLSERVHDLEKQLATLEAENEQYLLENKSMANKLRLAAMSGDGESDEALEAQAAALAEREKQLEESRKQFAEQQAQLAEQLALAEQKTAEAEQKSAKADERAAEAASIIEEAKAKLAEIEAGSEQSKSDTEQLKTDNERLKAKVEQLSAENEQLKADALRIDGEKESLRGQLSQANDRLVDTARQLSEKESAMAAIQAKISESESALTDSNSRLTQAESELATTRTKLSDTEGKLAKAEESLKVVQEVREQISVLEAEKRTTDAENRRMKDELLEKDEIIRVKDSDLISKNTTLRIKEDTIHRLEDQADSLRKNIETIQYEQSEKEATLRAEINRLRTLATKTAGAASADIISPATTDAPAYAIGAEAPAPEAISAQPARPSAELSASEFLAGNEDVDTPRPRRGRPPKMPPAETPEEAAAQEAALAALKGAPAPAPAAAPAVHDGPSLPGFESYDVPAATANSNGDSAKEDFADILDSTDWLIASPEASPAKRGKRKSKAAADDDFGYKEPPRQDPPDNPAQMLLW